MTLMPLQSARVRYREKPGLGTRMLWPSSSRAVMAMSMAPDPPLHRRTSSLVSGASGRVWNLATAALAKSYPKGRREK